MATTYNAFRLDVTKRIGDGAGFVAITELKLMNDQLPTSEQLLVGGIATASTIYGAGFEASKAFDGNESTRWATDNSALPQWIRYDLTTPIEKPGFIYIKLNNSPDNGPSDFTLSGSSDGGLTWSILADITGFATSSQISNGAIASLVSFGVKGYALNSSGSGAAKVRVYGWNGGSFFGEVTPSSNGEWSFQTQGGIVEPLLVVVIGSIGDRPQAHGPVTAVEMG